MIALNVPYAVQINKAAEAYGISPALLQGIIDEAGGLPSLPLLAQQYAAEYAREIGVETVDLNDGALHPESNIMGMARWFTYMNGRLQNQWETVEVFYGSGPRGRMKMLHLASGPYERRRRQWS